MALIVEHRDAVLRRVCDFRRDLFETLAAEDGRRAWAETSLRDVKRLLVILAAPRSGSSLLFSILRGLSCIYAPGGESVPFYKLNGLSSDAFVSDAVPVGFLDSWREDAALSRDFLSDFSCGDADDAAWTHYADDILMRFSLQWPQVVLRREEFRGVVSDVLSAHRRRPVFSPRGFYLDFLAVLMRLHPEINPYYYDIPDAVVAKAFPNLDIPHGPPSDPVVIEEPPFVVLAPERRIRREDLGQKILLLKSTADSYRMDVIETLFPRAEINVIYLTRNPLASINGLYDGWHHRGFFSHNLRFLAENGTTAFEGLRIKDYSDQYPWGRWWWKYDLPPGWRDYAARPLEEVCAFQWRAANEAILGYLGRKGVRWCRLRYEDITASEEAMARAVETVVDFLGAAKDKGCAFLRRSLPVVQATSPPRPFRWKEREALLKPLISDSKIRDMSARLGYDPNRDTAWP